jgi:hypothetical protein
MKSEVTGNMDAVYGVWEPVSHESITNKMEWWPSLESAESALRERISKPGVVTTSRQRLTGGEEKPDAQFYGTQDMSVIFLYETPASTEPYALLAFDAHGEVRKNSVPYCMGLRCEDCSADDPCCEATCECCPQASKQNGCWIRPGSEEGSRYCSEHGEGWLYDLPPRMQGILDILYAA